MRKEPLTYRMLTEKAKEDRIAFSNLLGGAVLEEIVRRISQSEYLELLWLRNGNVLGEEQYKKNLLLQLEYDYVIQRLKKSDSDKTDSMRLSELAAGLREKIFNNVTDYGIEFSLKGKIFKNYLQLQLLAELEGMQVPVSLKIHLLKDEKKIPKKETFTSMMFPKLSVVYYSYPMEGFLAEKYMEVITKLELIQNLKPYYDIYYLLEHESVDGRKVKEYIEEQCETNGIAKEKSRLDMIAGYKDYTYMKKKWKVFLRSVKSQEPGWEQVIERFVRFFEPIWQAIMEDLVFFGDWMPDLNRFL